MNQVKHSLSDRVRSLPESHDSVKEEENAVDDANNLFPYNHKYVYKLVITFTLNNLRLFTPMAFPAAV